MLNKEDPVVQHDSVLTGNLYYLGVLRSPNVHRFHDVTRMDKPTFLSLLKILKDLGGLTNSDRTVFISAGEKLMIVIGILKGNSLRQTDERWGWQHSTATIHHILVEVADAFMRIGGRF